LARFALVNAATFSINAANARRGYLSGKILVLIINQLCFAKQYLSGAPGDFSGKTRQNYGETGWCEATLAHANQKKSPVFLRGTELNLLTHLSKLTYFVIRLLII
jgi:hypothetical protein